VATSIQQLLSNASDFDLCNEVFKRIINYYGDDIDVSTLPHEHRVILLVWHSEGIIRNGGFNYLFEASFDGDPHFLLTAQAFRVIDCPPAFEAFQKAMALFPGLKPPVDLSRRLAIYRRGKGKTRHEIDCQFWDANDQIEKCLAAFIRANGKRFERLDNTNPEPRGSKARAAQQAPAGPALDFGSLPHWARVAFAARCARLVLQIFDVNWPDAPNERREAVATAIAVAEDSAAKARPSDRLKDSVLNAMITAGAAVRPVYKDDEFGPPDGNMATVAFFAVKAAEKAAEAAQATPDESERFVLEAFSFAQDAASDNDQLVERMYNELDRLRAVATRGNWTDDTPVPNQVFDLVGNDDDSKERPCWRSW
jgi:hypothetical protein